MIRNLDQLRQRYNTSSRHGNKRPMGPMRGGPGRRPGMGGKPKNTGAIVRRMLGYLRPNMWRLVLVLLCMFLTTVTSLVASYMLAPIINHLTKIVKPGAELEYSKLELLADKVISYFTVPLGNLIGNDAMTYVITAILILVVVYFISILSTYLQGRLMIDVTQTAIVNIRAELFEKLQRLPLRYFDSRPAGDIMSRFTNDVDNIRNMLNNSLLSVISGVITLIGTFVFMLTTSFWLTLVTILFIPIFTGCGALIAKRSSKYFSAQQAALGAVNGYVEETISGVKVVKVFNHEDTCNGEFGILNDDMRDKQLKAQFWGGITGPVIGNMSQIAYALTVGLGGVLMVLGHMTPGGLSVFATYSKQFARPINNISMQLSTVFSALAGAERVFAVIDETPETPDREGAMDGKRIQGNVELHDVTFGYVEGKTVLHGLSLYAKAGQKIAFVGSTGAGKTTITNLLNRFYDIEEGSITIDGVDIRDYQREELRRNIAMVLQDTHLFTGTVMENIRYGRLDATDEEVIAAAKVASAHSMIMRLSDGYDTILTGDGANLSQGQRQLLNIARAALSKAPILVLDEATSSVDTRTERHIEHGMDRLMKTRTTFVIAHRLSTVRNANAIMVLEDGRIIERGTHEQLLALGGRYYELYTGKRELD